MMNYQPSFNHQLSVHTSLLEADDTSLEGLFTQLSQSIRSNQWIWFTSQSVRPSTVQLSSFNIPVNQVIQLKSSSSLSEFEVATKAIKSGNASALVVSNAMTPQQKNHLEKLSRTYQCCIFFVKPDRQYFH